MKKYWKVLMLSAVVLSSVQSALTYASDVKVEEQQEATEQLNPSLSEQDNNVELSSSSQEIEGDVNLTNGSSEEKPVSSEDNTIPSVSSEVAEKDSAGTPENSTTEKSENDNKEIQSKQEPKVRKKRNVEKPKAKVKRSAKEPVKLVKLPIKYGGAPFRDIGNSIFKNNINWLYSRGVTTGYNPTTYGPNNQVTRGEMAVFIHRLAGSPKFYPTKNVYRDITQYKNQILWLDSNNITNGTAPYYNPNGKVTRGQMAAFLHRLAKVTGKAPTSGRYNSKFWDTQGNMFKNDIGWLSSKGITTGYTATSFKPNDYITRGEMSAFLYRFYSVTVDNKKLSPAPQPHAKQPVYYSQLDNRWRGIKLNSSNVGVSGCVATSLAMVLRGSYGVNVDPGFVALKADRISREYFGLSGTDLINTSKAYGHNVEVVGNQNRAMDLLKAGYPIIFYINVGVGHAVVAYGYDNGTVSVNDPYGRQFYPSGKTTLSELWGRPSRDSMDWNAGRPVFAIK